MEEGFVQFRGPSAVPKMVYKILSPGTEQREGCEQVEIEVLGWVPVAYLERTSPEGKVRAADVAEARKNAGQ